MADKQILIQKWLENSCNGKTWSDMLASYGIQKIDIYGAGDLGKYLTLELEQSDIHIRCFIDRRGNEIMEYMGYPTYTMGEYLKLPLETDAIVVTVEAADEEVLETMVRAKPEMPVLSLKDILYEM